MTDKEIRNNFLKNLMTGLLYPAVLGNIFYIILSVFEDPSQYGEGEKFNLKVVILLITTVFYLCDYLYIYFTNNFKWWMFVFDLAFVISLFLTYQKLNLTMSEKDTSPEVLKILWFYLFFIVLYFVWDNIEQNKTTNENEKKMYKWILRWEYFSGAILIINIGLHHFDRLIVVSKDLISIYSIEVITILFCCINIWKCKFWMQNEKLKAK